MSRGVIRREGFRVKVSQASARALLQGVDAVQELGPTCRSWGASEGETVMALDAEENGQVSTARKASRRY